MSDIENNAEISEASARADASTAPEWSNDRRRKSSNMLLALEIRVDWRTGQLLSSDDEVIKYLGSRHGISNTSSLSFFSLYAFERQLLDKFMLVKLMKSEVTKTHITQTRDVPR